MKYSIITLVITALILVGCGSESATNKGSTNSTTIKATETTDNTDKANKVATQTSQTMMFFLNPNGRPCKRQIEILNEMSEQLKAKNIEVKYVSTEKMNSDGPIFMQYGVRALPTIILVDEKGAEKKRFSPGVQSQVALLEAIK